MRDWINRSPEVAALLNPAFCAFLISSGLDAYIKNEKEGAPFLFPFIMLPLVLHKPTRQMFPRTTRTTFSSWITNADTAIAKVGFAERARNLVPYIQESLTFAIQNRSLLITDAGLLKSVSPARKSIPNATQEVNECVRASIMCGKWFSMVGDFKTAMALLGVRP